MALWLTLIFGTVLTIFIAVVCAWEVKSAKGKGSSLYDLSNMMGEVSPRDEREATNFELRSLQSADVTWSLTISTKSDGSVATLEHGRCAAHAHLTTFLTA